MFLVNVFISKKDILITRNTKRSMTTIRKRFLEFCDYNAGRLAIHYERKISRYKEFVVTLGSDYKRVCYWFYW